MTAPGRAAGGLVVLVLCAAPGCGGSIQATRGPGASGRILAEPPGKADPGATYLFYLHGRIVQEQGREAVSKDYGRYEYDEILRRFASEGLVVISDVRPPGTEVEACAGRVVKQIRTLLEAGVPASRITVVGASMGGVIAMAVSTRMDQRDLGYVLMGACDDDTLRRFGSALHGSVLSIFEASDDERSCAEFFARSTSLGRHAEIRLDTGLRHGFLYRPLADWMEPAVRWARERSAPGAGGA